MITVTMTIPKTFFDIPKLIEGCATAVNETNNDAHKNFKDTIKDFSAESQFEFNVQSAKMTGGVISASTGTDNENYVRLNQGTEDHIVGAGGKWMSFYPIYRAKTRPFVARSRPGGPDGVRQRAKGPWKVRGIEPRAFDVTIYTLNKPKFYRRIDAAYKKAVKAK